MKSRLNKKLLMLIFTMTCAAFSYEMPTMSYVTSSTVFSRSISMGGAFTAMQAGLENVLFNPAAMGIKTTERSDFSIYFNPVGATSALLQRSELSGRSTKEPLDWLSSIGLFARAVSFSTPGFQVTALLSEELPNNPQKLDDKIISTRGHLDWNYSAVAARLTLAKQVSMGATGYVFHLHPNDEQKEHYFGSSYGILMRPGDKLSAGVSYFNFPQSADTLMLLQHRISNKSINVGVVYSPIQKIRMALDFRNVSQGDSNTTNEVHTGIEIVPTRFFALRGGYFRQNENKVDTMSLGFGFADFRTYSSRTERFVFSNIILNYGLQAEMHKSDYSLVHYLTFLVRF